MYITFLCDCDVAQSQRKIKKEKEWMVRGMGEETVIGM